MVVVVVVVVFCAIVTEQKTTRDITSVANIFFITKSFCKNFSGKINATAMQAQLRWLVKKKLIAYVIDRRFLSCDDEESNYFFLKILFSISFNSE